MANMSYCRFENTLGDLRDCVDAMECVVEGEKPRLLINSYEVISARSMVEYCRMYIELYNELEQSGKIVNSDDNNTFWDDEETEENS